MTHLTEGQQRAIKSMIMLTEEKLLEMERWLYFTNKPAQTGIQSEVVDDLTEEEKMTLQLQIEEMKNVLKDFSYHYHLQSLKELKSLKNILNVKATFMWEDISGATFNRLKNYGDIDDDQRALYEQFINPLNTLINDIIHIKS